MAAGGSDMEFAPVESSCEDLSSDEPSGDSDMVCLWHLETGGFGGFFRRGCQL